MRPRPGTNESRSDVGTWQTGMKKFILNDAGARNPSCRVDGQRQNWLNQIPSPTSRGFFGLFGLFGLATGESELCTDFCSILSPFLVVIVAIHMPSRMTTETRTKTTSMLPTSNRFSYHPKPHHRRIPP